MEIAGLVVQILILFGLIWYAWETLKIRKTSQKQIAISQEQNETMEKPCLVLSVRKRRDLDTATDVLGGNPRPGLSVPDAQQSGTGHITLHNIGAGPAFNIQYEVRIQGEPKKFTKACLPYISKGEQRPIFLTENDFSTLDQHEDVEFMVSCKSLSGWRYESVIHLQQTPGSESVVTEFQFRTYPPQRGGCAL